MVVSAFLFHKTESRVKSTLTTQYSNIAIQAQFNQMKTSTITLIIAQLVAIVSAQTGKLVPLHQYNFGQKGKGELVSSDQFYTTNFDEMNRCKGKDGYRYEGIAAYVYECSVRDTVPLYRFVLDTKKYKGKK